MKKGSMGALLAGVLAAVVAALAAQPISAAPDEDRSDRDRRPKATLEGRAIYPVERRGEGSIDAPAPFPDQPVGGYSALLDARGKNTYIAMPDNGYGSKANSPGFVLRVDTVRVDYETARRNGGSGEVEVLDSVYLRDPDGKVPFEIVDEGEGSSGQRLLTGSDFDPESMRVARDGTWWFGDEFGPFLLHTDATGKVLEAPVPLPGVKAPEDPTRPEQAVNLPGSSGFEGMAISTDRRYLYPSLERALATDPDTQRRLIYEFDLRRGEYTGKTWQYGADPVIPTTPPGQPQHVIGDLTALDRNRLLVIERDFRQGEAAIFSKIFVVDLRREDDEGFLLKREVVDLLDIRDPNLISLRGPVRPGDYGLGDPFEFPYVTTESVLPVGGKRLAIVNDNNFGSVGGRNPSLPDYTDFILVRAEDLRGPVGRPGEED